jgi:hypothetical protein
VDRVQEGDGKWTGYTRMEGSGQGTADEGKWTGYRRMMGSGQGTAGLRETDRVQMDAGE